MRIKKAAGALMQTKLFVTLISLFISIQAMAQTNQLRCFVSANPGGEIQIPQNEMKTPRGFPHLKGQSFQKIVKLKDGSTADFIITLRAKDAKTFDFRINSFTKLNLVHITAALDNQDMFQYTNYSSGFSVQCTKNYEAK
jgi:hypothetical protein